VEHLAISFFKGILNFIFCEQDGHKTTLSPELALASLLSATSFSLLFLSYLLFFRLEKIENNT
jgi:hypothetical protein